MLVEHQAVQISKAHGRREVREIRVSSALVELRRTWTCTGVTTQEVQDGITSLPQQGASAERVLTLKRGHWAIENRLHYVKDVTLREDTSTLHGDAGPDIMALVRNAAIRALRRAGQHRIAAGLRHNRRCPQTSWRCLVSHRGRTQPP